MRPRKSSSFNFNFDFSSKKFKVICISVIAGIIALVAGVFGYTKYQEKKAAEAAANVDYSLQTLTEDQLQGGNYYINDGSSFYQVAPGTLYSSKDDDTAIATEASPDTRMVMFGKDDEQIPTLYKDSKLIYKSSDFNNPSAEGTVESTPTDFYLERFYDEGYSIGVRGLTNIDGTKFRTTISGVTYYPGSDASLILPTESDKELTLDKVNGVPISTDNVTSAGTIKGLTQGQSYTVDAYVGTSPVGGSIIADTHMFTSYELYDIKDYDLSENGYAVITMPDYMWSGYYYINGVGMFRYVNGYKTYGTDGVDYNTAYFMGTDKDNNIITNPATTLNDKPADNASTSSESNSSISDDDTTNNEEPTWHYDITIDNQQKNMNLSIDYSEAMTYVDSDNNGEYELVSASSGAIIPGAEQPAAILKSPDGTVYEMTTSGSIVAGTMSSQTSDSAEEASSDMQMANSLLANIDNPAVGTWSIDITGMYSRTFSVNTTYAGSTTDMVVKDGSDPTQMIVYVPETLKDGIFKFTWEDTNHAGTFSVDTGDITVTNEKKADGSSENVKLETYGEVDLNVGALAAGEYTINISGESLGHVYFSYAENGVSDSGNSNSAENASSIK